MALNALNDFLPPAPENTSPPPEFSALPPEMAGPAGAFATPAEGITPPADEFEPAEKTEETKKKSSLIKRIKKVMYGATAALLSVAVAGGSSLFPGSSSEPSYWNDDQYTVISIYYERVEGSTASFTYRLPGDSEFDFPVQVDCYATDENGKRIDYESDTVEEPEVEVERAVDISELDQDTKRVVWVKVNYERRGVSDSLDVDAVTIAPGSNEVVHFKDPEIHINSAVLDRTSGRSVVKYSFTIDRNDAELPLPVTVRVVDAFGLEARGDNQSWGSTGTPLTGEIDVTNLSMISGLRLIVTANFIRNGRESVTTEMQSVEEGMAPGPVDEPETYPLEGGTVVVTVYNNSFDMSRAEDPVFPYMMILEHSEFNAKDFDEMVLPAAYDPNSDFDPAGYVLHIGNPFDIGFDAEAANSAVSENSKGLISLNSGYAVPLSGNVLTREDVEKVKPTMDGTRYVNVHVVWKSVADEAEKKLPLELDYGDHVETVEADTPFASEGFFYLCAVDQPLTEGKTLIGWQDEAGNLYDFVSYYDFFPMLPGAQSNEDRDWQNPVPIRLTAVWRNWSSR